MNQFFTEVKSVFSAMTKMCVFATEPIISHYEYLDIIMQPKMVEAVSRAANYSQVSVRKISWTASSSIVSYILVFISLANCQVMQASLQDSVLQVLVILHSHKGNNLHYRPRESRVAWAMVEGVARDCSRVTRLSQGL